MRTIYQDLRYGIRVLRRNPGFTAVALEDPGRLMLVSLTTPVTPNTPFDEDVPWSYPKYTTFRELQQVFVASPVPRGRTWNG